MSSSVHGGRLRVLIEFARRDVTEVRAFEDREVPLLRDEYLAQSPVHLSVVNEAVSAIVNCERDYQAQTRAVHQRNRDIGLLGSSAKITPLNLLDDDLSSAIQTCTDALRTIHHALQAHEAQVIDEITASPILAAFRRWLSVFTKRLEDVVQYKTEVKERFDDAVRNAPGRKVPRWQVDFPSAFKDYIQRSAIQEAKRRPLFEPLSTMPEDNTIQWVPIHHFSGGMSQATLLVGVNATTRTVKRRMVRKDTVQSHHQWGSAKYWRGDLPDGPNMLPTEYVSQRLMSGAPNSRFTPKTLGDVEIKPEACSYHMMMEFAANGDLSDVCHAHREANVVVPELFVWLVFQALVESALTMRRGNSDLNGASREDWMEIVHRDLKPNNVFLGLPSGSHFIRYPRPQVGDFGLSCLTYSNDPLNPVFWAPGGGTRGFQAPEQFPCADSITKKGVDDFELLSPCNVWGIGIIMYCLMTLREVNERTQPPHIGPNLEYDLEANLPAHANYDATLRSMVQQCLSFKPRNRPGIEFLKDWIDLQMTTRETLIRANRGDAVFGGTVLHKQEMARAKTNAMFMGALPQREVD